MIWCLHLLVVAPPTLLVFLMSDQLAVRSPGLQILITLFLLTYPTYKSLDTISPQSCPRIFKVSFDATLPHVG